MSKRLIFYNHPYGLTHGNDRCRVIHHTHKRRLNSLKTVEEITSYLEIELAEAEITYDLLKTEDKQRALFHLVKMATITEILEEIKR